MSRRKRSSASRSKLSKSLQSDFIKVTQRPRSLILDPICGRCRGRMPKMWDCLRCRGTGKDPEGDKWFDNQDRVRTTYGPKNGKLPLGNSTYTRYVWDPDLQMRVVRFSERRKNRGTDNLLDRGTMPNRFQIQKGGYRVANRHIPPTIGIGAPIENLDGSVEGPSHSAVVYTKNNLPRLFVVQKIEQLNAADRLTIVDKMDTFYVVRHGDESRLKVMFAGNKYCFVEEFQTYARRSMIYTGKEIVDRLSKNEKQIVWKDVLK